MKKKLIATGLAFCMTVAMAGTALAVDGTAATVPKDETAGGDGQASTGAAVINSVDGITFNTTDDDDDQAAVADTTGADINVWAKVIDGSTKVYKVDLAWGAMKFEFNSGGGQWNTTSHQYDGGDVGDKKWTETYLDGENNKIAVTNHSNNGIDAAFDYAMDTSAFNDNVTVDSVTGNFFEDNTKAAAAAKVLTGVAAVTDKLTDSKISLATADAYNSTDGEPNSDANNVTAGERTKDVFFAFSGTPDEGKGKTLDTFKKVGVITVTVAPNDTPSLNQPVYTAP